MLALFVSGQACLQTELVKISNTGQITDYMTNEDEIELIFGVSDIFFYKFDQNFIKNMYFDFEPGQITFPCFT